MMFHDVCVTWSISIHNLKWDPAAESPGLHKWGTRTAWRLWLPDLGATQYLACKAQTYFHEIYFQVGQPPRKRSGVRGIVKEANRVHGTLHVPGCTISHACQTSTCIQCLTRCRRSGQVPLLFGLLHKTPRRKNNKTRIHRGRQLMTTNFLSVSYKSKH